MTRPLPPPVVPVVLLARHKPSSSLRRRRRLRSPVLGAEDFVDEAVVLGGVGVHEEVAVSVADDVLDGLAGVLGEDLADQLVLAEDLAGVDLDIGGLAADAADDGLVDVDGAVGQGVALALGAGAEEDGAHAGAAADGRWWRRRTDELHRVVDCQTGADGATRRVDVHVDILVRVLAVEVEELGDDDVGDLVVDWRAEEDDALLQQQGKDIERALAAGARLNNVWNDGADVRLSHDASSLKPAHSPLFSV